MSSGPILIFGFRRRYVEWLRAVCRNIRTISLSATSFTGGTRPCPVQSAESIPHTLTLNKQLQGSERTTARRTDFPVQALQRLYRQLPTCPPLYPAGNSVLPLQRITCALLDASETMEYADVRSSRGLLPSLVRLREHSNDGESYRSLNPNEAPPSPTRFTGTSIFAATPARSDSPQLTSMSGTVSETAVS